MLGLKRAPRLPVGIALESWPTVHYWMQWNILFPVTHVLHLLFLVCQGKQAPV